MFFFFFQAEDGIRDYKVTGVQTCALPIFIFSMNGTPGLFRVPAAGGKPESITAVDPSRGEIGHAYPQFLGEDRKSTRLNSSHLVISYAVFCLKKKKTNTHDQTNPTPQSTI